MPRPNLKITGLHVDGLKALHRVDWPADGLGWNGVVPDMVMVGGANGSGKTTLLEFILWGAQCLSMADITPPVTTSTSAWITVDLASGPISGQFTYLLGDTEFLRDHEKNAPHRSTFQRVGSRYAPLPGDPYFFAVQQNIADRALYEASDIPRVVYLPSDRTLVIPEETFKTGGSLVDETQKFVYTLRQPLVWKESLEALFYNARWKDLNAKEEGRSQDATRFKAFADAFALFFESRKQVAWRGGELVVVLADRVTTHSLTDLSSGEKQVILLAAELLYRWRPGSLILIDEPELHLHPTWLSRLWAMLTQWQRERGGQVIVATQSNHLFRIGEPGTKVLLGQDPIA